MPYFGGAGGDEGVKFRLGASISFTGSFLYNYNFLIAPPDNLQVNNTPSGPIWGSWLENFTYSEGNLSGGLTSLTFNDLVGCKGNFTPVSQANITSFSAANLTFVGGTFGPADMAALTTFSIGNLTTILGDCVAGNFSTLAALNLGSLKYIGGNFNPQFMALLTTLTLTNLVFILGNFIPKNMAALVTLSLPALQYVAMTPATSIIGNSIGAGLTTINLPALVQCANSGIDFHTGNGNITTVTLGAAGTTKQINGNVNFGGQKLNQASVDQILHTIASLDGTGGTTSWGAARTLTLNGGTNSTPSAAGLADKAIIVARGATVLNN